MLFDLMLGEINARAQALRPVKDAQGNTIRPGSGDAAEYRAIVSAYKDLVQTMRLQTGLSTTNVAGKMDATVSVEGFDAYAARMIAEKGLDETDG
jgi:ribosome-binding protein aMBF1 (putative translation factor)